MTSDAKIGLLLGLVFIFVIAFLINGLPSFTQADDNNELTTNMVTSPNTDDIGIAGNSRELTEREVTRATVSDNQPAKSPETKPADKVTTRKQSEKDVRFETELPETDTKVSNVRETEEGNESAASSEEVSTDKGNELPAEYVVRKGDNLASIARKFYGEKAGNKLESIDKIFEANRNKLDSRDEIYAGQSLRIPPLSSGQNTGSKSIGNELSEKIRSVSEKLTGTGEKKRYYTVEEGDSLWKIAYKCLGDGSRYKEIAKLNSDKLESEDHLLVGMRLEIPTEQE